MDDTRHYLVCPILWPIICSIMNLQALDARDLFGRDISSKLSLHAPSEVKIKAIAFAFRLYHFLKHNHLNEVHLYKREGNLEEVLNIILDAGCAIWRHSHD